MAVTTDTRVDFFISYSKFLMILNLNTIEWNKNATDLAGILLFNQFQFTFAVQVTLFCVNTMFIRLNVFVFVDSNANSGNIFKI